MSELKKDFKNRIEFYSGENSNAEDIVGGHTSKTFVRLNDDSENFLLRKEKLKRFKYRNFISRYLQRKMPKDSQFFKPLFYELMNKNSHYITYLNELFEDKRIDLPTHVSCLIKKAYTMEEGGVYGECYGSRLANAFEVDTVYNVPYSSKYDFDNMRYFSPFDMGKDVYDYMISVDFVAPGERVETFEDLGIDFSDNTFLGEIITKIENKFEALVGSENLVLDYAKLEKLKRDFAKLYLFRTFVCNDKDFKSKNVGLLINKNGDFRLAPCFDMELFFQGGFEEFYFKFMAERTFEYLGKNMPDVIEDFLKTSNKVLKNKTIDSIFQDTLYDPAQKYFGWSKDLKRNIKLFKNCYNEYKNNHEMGE